MGLTNITLPTRTITPNPDRPDESFKVRGVCLDDIPSILDAAPGQLEEAISSIQFDDDGNMDAKSALQNAAVKLPLLVATLIAVVAREEGDDLDHTISVALKLGAVPTMQALVDIFELTVVNEAEVKKLLETVVRIGQTVNSVVDEMELTDFVGGITSSAEMSAVS